MSELPHRTGSTASRECEAAGVTAAPGSRAGPPNRSQPGRRRPAPDLPSPQSDSENAVINQKLTQYPAWRLLPVHAVAKLFGVPVKVDGLPFGSNRLYRATPATSEVAGEAPSASRADVSSELRRAAIAAATIAATDALRGAGEIDPVKAARQVAEAAVAAWQVVNGVSPSLFPDEVVGTPR